MTTVTPETVPANVYLSERLAHAFWLDGKTLAAVPTNLNGTHSLQELLDVDHFGLDAELAHDCLAVHRFLATCDGNQEALSYADLLESQADPLPAGHEVYEPQAERIIPSSSIVWA